LELRRSCLLQSVNEIYIELISWLNNNKLFIPVLTGLPMETPFLAAAREIIKL